MNPQDPKYQQKSKSIPSAEPNYFVHFAMRYPVLHTIYLLSMEIPHFFWKSDIQWAFLCMLNSCKYRVSHGKVNKVIWLC